MRRVLVFNGWAAGPETWALCTFRHDWLFSYIEALDGLPDRVMADFDDVILVGFSMGGSMALKMLLTYPAKVKGLVLVSSTPRMMEDPETEWRGLSERRLAALRLGTQFVFRDDPSPIYDHVSMDRGLAYLHSVDLRAELKSRRDEFDTLPVAIFQSARDGIVRPHNAAFLQGVFKRARVSMIPGGEHVLPVVIPERISAAVEELQIAVNRVRSAE